MAAIVDSPCGCTNGSRCPEANAMWERANGVYHTQGHDAWMEALAPYREHMKDLARWQASTADQRRRARALRAAEPTMDLTESRLRPDLPRPSDEELPGMWEHADFVGGRDEVRGADWTPDDSGRSTDV